MINDQLTEKNTPIGIENQKGMSQRMSMTAVV